MKQLKTKGFWWPRNLVGVAGMYLLLLSASHLWQYVQRPHISDNLPPSLLAHTVHPGPGANAPVMVLLHGAAETRQVWQHMSDAPFHDFQTISLDLPGYGQSSNLKTPTDAWASLVLATLDHLQVHRFHLTARGFHGPLAMKLAAENPQRVQSLVLLSSAGMEDFLLLGEASLNQALFSAFSATTWLIFEATPHFGALNSYRKWQTFAQDLRSWNAENHRNWLRRVDCPVMLIHGQHDPWIPAAAAREHSRLIPQSEILLTDDKHELMNAQQGEWTAAVTGFLSRASRATALWREQADTARIAASKVPHRTHPIPPFSGTVLWVALVFIAFGTLISEDLACIGAGLLYARGLVEFHHAVLASLIGIFIGDVLLFLAGRWLGRPILNRPPLKWLVREEEIQRSTQWFRIRGPLVILLTRFLPGTRLPTYVAAGIFRTPLWRFSLYFIIAASLWTPLLVALSAWMGQTLLDFFMQYQKYALLMFVLGILLIRTLLKVGTRMLTQRGRRLLWSSWMRLTHWEFWPPYVFYLPMVVYVFWLGIRHRHLTLFTACNPGMPGSGFVGESKSDILMRLSASGETVTPFTLLEPGQRMDTYWTQINQWHAERGMGGISFPVVWKPDQGQRGAGVRILRSERELTSALEDMNERVILQEFAPGFEFGVFYVRHPQASTGRIFSITEKQFPTLTGDGQHTLEELILMDARAVCMASFHMKRHADRLFWVPEKGETVALVELGTHARGSVFLDGLRYWTPELETRIDEISQQFDGFFFGRYDIRVPSLEDFRAGKNLRIIELNGVTSEATAIYDPTSGLLNAYRTLMKQWKLAFEFGAINHRQGVRTLSLAHTARLILTRGREEAQDTLSQPSATPN